jgi:FtsP/CotA-like multicopper oxidase with cupredoxin domain
MKTLFTIVLGALLFWSKAQEIDLLYEMPAQMSGSITLKDGTSCPIWVFKNGFSGAVTLPNFLIEANSGDSVELKVYNLSQMEHTVHLHGLDVDQANDGVGGTSETIQPFGTKSYYFKSNDPGLYFYHCHVESPIHVQMGMYGGVLIRPENGAKTAYNNGPSFDKDYNWIIGDIDIAWHEDAPENGEINSFNPSYLIVNGLGGEQIGVDTNTSITVKSDEKAYLRIGNISYGITTIRFPEGISAELIQTDGRPIPSPKMIQSVEIYPGERYELMLTSEEALIDSITVDYQNMYSDEILMTEKVPVHFEEITGIDRIEKSKIHVFPNPTTGRFTIDFPKDWSSAVVVRVYKMDGTLVHETSKSGLTENLQKGMYLIECEHKKEIVRSKILVK